MDLNHPLLIKRNLNNLFQLIKYLGEIKKLKISFSMFLKPNVMVCYILIISFTVYMIPIPVGHFDSCLQKFLVYFTSERKII